MSLTKSFERMARPELRCFGILVEGCLEAFYLIPDTTSKDSSLTTSLVHHALMKTKEMLQKHGIPMPQDLRVHSDNAPADQKNVHMVRWISWLTHQGYFKKAVLSMFRSGHSHNKIDQRFSEVRGALSRARVLESPTDFRDAILAGVMPRQGRELQCEVVYGSYNWHSFLDVGITLMGHYSDTRTFPEA